MPLPKYSDPNRFLNREDLYRFLWDIYQRDRIIVSIRTLAETYGVKYQTLSIVMREFVALGLLHKDRHSWFCIHDPDEVPWDKYMNLREKYVRHLQESS